MSRDQPVNTTSYEHPADPNLRRLENAMGYRDGIPHLRVDLGSDNVTISGNVNIADHITVDNTTSNPVPVTVQNTSLAVTFDRPVAVTDNNGSLTVDGTVNIGNWPTTQPVSLTSLPDSNVTIKNASLAVTGTFWQATQPVSIATMPVTPISDNGGSITVDGTVSANVSGTVSISQPVAITDNNGSITVDGSVSITSLPEVEIKNDSGNPISISKDTNANSTTNRIYVSQETDVILADSNYEMNVARGLVPGQYVEMKNGYCPTMSSGGATVWSQGTVYPWASWTTAQPLFVISTSASDTGQGLYIEGLDASYNKISEIVTTSGTTAVQTVNSYLRINRGYLVSGNVNVGTITQRLTSGTGTVIGGMVAGSSRNKQGTFTVPNGYTAYILYGDLSSYKNGQGQIDGQVDMKVRTSATAPFMTVFAAIAANGQYRNDFNVPLAVPQRSDIDVQFNSSGTCTVACNWEMILIPN